MNTTILEIKLEPTDNARLQSLCGPLDSHLQQIEQQLGIAIHRQGSHFKLMGASPYIDVSAELLQHLYQETLSADQQIITLDAQQVHLALQSQTIKPATLATTTSSLSAKQLTIQTKRGVIKPRTDNQKRYLQHILTHDISFGIGPAGTGKTYLAVAAAVDALEKQEIRRILLTRPAVEAGEKLGFLPGDLSQKVDPYLRPLYDALFEMLGFEKVEKLIERNIIEIAPLAYMRGRTLNDAFIILDESQNTTIEQMKMFLTRIGFNAKAVITGDVTQIDLPRHQQSGLKQAIEVLANVAEVSFDFFQSSDVVRHPIVAKIVDAYACWDNEQKQ